MFDRLYTRPFVFLSPVQPSFTFHKMSVCSTMNLVTPRVSRPSTPSQKPSLAVDTFQSTNHRLLSKSRLTNISATTAVSPDLYLVQDLKSGMKASLRALGIMFDALSEQTGRLSELGPALQAIHQVSVSSMFFLVLTAGVDQYSPRTNQRTTIRTRNSNPRSQNPTP